MLLDQVTIVVISSPLGKHVILNVLKISVSEDISDSRMCSLDYYICIINVFFVPHYKSFSSCRHLCESHQYLVESNLIMTHQYTNCLYFLLMYVIVFFIHIHDITNDVLMFADEGGRKPC